MVRTLMESGSSSSIVNASRQPGACSTSFFSFFSASSWGRGVVVRALQIRHGAALGFLPFHSCATTSDHCMLPWLPRIFPARQPPRCNAYPRAPPSSHRLRVPNHGCCPSHSPPTHTAITHTHTLCSRTFLPSAFAFFLSPLGLVTDGSVRARLAPIVPSTPSGSSSFESSALSSFSPSLS